MVAAPADARNIYVANYCPLDVVFELWRQDGPLTYTFSRRESAWLNDRHGARIEQEGRTIRFKAKPKPTHGQRSSALDQAVALLLDAAGGDWMLWQGQQVVYDSSTRYHVYRDTWGDVDIELCGYPSLPPWFPSIPSDGDAQISCPVSIRHLLWFPSIPSGRCGLPRGAPTIGPWAAKWRAEMDRTLALTARVVERTERRVFGGETVPASEKVVSLFEPHTDVVARAGAARSTGTR